MVDSGEIDTVCAAVQNALKTTVLDGRKISEDAINKVYRIDMRDGPVVLKIFRSRTWPEAGKLEWINQELAKLEITQPKILFQSSGNSFLPRPFIIWELIDGTNIETLIRRGALTQQEFCERLGDLLARVHRVNIVRYGAINGGKGMHSSFISLFERQHGIDTLRRNNGVDEQLYSRVKDKLIGSFAQFEQRFSAVLTHGDPSIRNCLLTTDGQLVLLDWDNASASLWTRDYAHVTYSCAKAMRFKSVAPLAEIRKSFFHGYGTPDFMPAEIDHIEQAWHVLWSYNALARASETHSPGHAPVRDYLFSLL